MSLNLLNPLLSLCKTLWVTFVKMSKKKASCSSSSLSVIHSNLNPIIMNILKKSFRILSFYWVFGHLLNVGWILSINSSDVCLLFGVWYAQLFRFFFFSAISCKSKKRRENTSVNIKTAELRSFWKSMLPKRSDAPAGNRLTQLTILT